jgi:biopolymer transport protein ExbB/TolQ
MFNILAANFKDYVIAILLLSIVIMGIYIFKLKDINAEQSILIAKQSSQIEQLVLVAKQNQDAIDQLKSINDKLNEDFNKFKESIKNQETMYSNVEKNDDSLKTILNDNLITVDKSNTNDNNSVKDTNSNKSTTVNKAKHSVNTKQANIASNDLSKPQESLVNFTNKINSLLLQQ